MTVTIGRRYRGPEDSGNGGYTCGLFARFVAPDAEITLRAPPPLDTPLSVERTEDAGVEIYHGEVLIAQGQTVDFTLDVPEPPSLLEAEAAKARYAGHSSHAFPTCFVCGVDREPGDGLRIWPGRLTDREVWASPWQPDDSLATEDGVLDTEIIWAALDCAGAWSVERATQDRPVVLGRMTARLEQPAREDVTYMVIAWPIGEDGRKLFSGTAIFDKEGTRYGFALQTWFVLS